MTTCIGITLSIALLPHTIKPKKYNQSHYYFPLVHVYYVFSSHDQRDDDDQPNPYFHLHVYEAFSSHNQSGEGDLLLSCRFLSDLL
jgi:hypothetical protein